MTEKRTPEEPNAKPRVSRLRRWLKWPTRIAAALLVLGLATWAITEYWAA